MFWGLIMEPQKRYSQVIKKAFHISMASLDLSNSDGQPSQVMCGYEGRNYLLCTLQKPSMLQCPLDLCFEEGTTVSFATNGKSHVHLTGYLTKDDFEGDSEGESDQEAQEFEVKAQKKPRVNDDTESQPSKKKAKKSKAVEEEEDDDTDDSDVDIDKLMNTSDGEEKSEEESGEEEEFEDEGSEEEDEESTEEEEDDVEDEDEKEVKGAALMNGVSAKKGKGSQSTTPKKDQQAKQKSSPKQTPGPKAKKQENSGAEEQKKKGKEEKKTKENQPANLKKKTLSGGVVVEELREGHGDSAVNGKFVHVYYEGRLKSNNKVFDKTNNGPGFGFRLGKGEVIKGWDIGVAGMKAGGKRRITCPPHLAYGAKGSPPVIPPNSTLVFEVELKKVK